MREKSSCRFCCLLYNRQNLSACPHRFLVELTIETKSRQRNTLSPTLVVTLTHIFEGRTITKFLFRIFPPSSCEEERKELSFILLCFLPPLRHILHLSSSLCCCFVSFPYDPSSSQKGPVPLGFSRSILSSRSEKSVCF